MKINLYLLSILFLYAVSSIAQKSTFSYSKSWSKVEQLEKVGLPKSALVEVNKVYKVAQADNNEEQLVKSIIYRLKLNESQNETAHTEDILSLEKEISVAKFPTRNLLHSVVAELYWNYYSQNRWNFNNRTTLANSKDTNIETWSLEKIVSTCAMHHKASLSEATALQKISIEKYQELIVGSNTLGKKYRPTLFDFIAHRAVDFFSNEEPNLTQPVYAFQMNAESFLSNAENFSTLKITSKDTSSFKLHALQILQQLIQFHVSDKDASALIDVDLKRLEFVYQQSTVSTKKKLYLEALQHIIDKYRSLPISTRASFQIASLYKEQGSEYKAYTSESNRWDLKKAFDIAQAAIELHPDSYGAYLCKQLQEQLQTKQIAIQIEQANVPNEPFLASVEYSNVNQLYWQAIPVAKGEVSSVRKKLVKKQDINHEEEFLRHFIEKPYKTAGTVQLTDPKDFQSHRTEIKLDALPAGDYMIIVSASSVFSTSNNCLNYAYTSQTNISYIHRSMKDGSTEFYLLHRKTGLPLNGVKAEIKKYIYNSSTYQSTLEPWINVTSNKKGYIKVPFQEGGFMVNFEWENNTLSTHSADDYGILNGIIYSNIVSEETESTQTIFFLDRSIYRPGQTLYFKGLITRGKPNEQHVVSKEQVTVILSDVNQQEVRRQTFTSNDYGTFQGTFILPSHGLTGEMTLSTEDVDNEVSFSVEEYKRPQFEVQFDSISQAYKLGELVTVTTKAQAYSGAMVDGAQVKYRIVRNARFPYWWFCYKGFYPSSPEVEIGNGTGITDAKGKFNIQFKAIADEQVDSASAPVFSYTVYADITDMNGETRSNSFNINIGYKALELGVALGDLDKSITNLSKEKIAIQSKNTSGGYEASKGQIHIYRLQPPQQTYKSRLWERPDMYTLSKEEFAKSFPNNVYNNEDQITQWTKAEEVFTQEYNTTSQTYFTLPNCTQWKSGQYILEITSKDRYQQVVKEIVYFKVFSSKEKTVTTPSIDYVELLTPKVEPQNTAQILVGTSAAYIEVLYELEQDGNVLQSGFQAFRNEQRILEIPIKESYRGNVVAHLTFVLDNRLYKHSLVIEIPFTNKQLDIAFETFRDHLQPGEKEQWRLKIKGKNSDKVAAEMVATLYDASLDEFRIHQWFAEFYDASLDKLRDHQWFAEFHQSTSSQLNWHSNYGFSTTRFNPFAHNWNKYTNTSKENINYGTLHWFGYNYSYPTRLVPLFSGAPREAKLSNKATKPAPPPQLDQIKTRSNKNETAFFYPNLYTNADGEIIINFTIPEALTRWKMLGFAHTQNLATGFISKELVTQKTLMIVPNAPRFFREGDSLYFSAKLSNLATKALTGQVQLSFFDALTMKPIHIQSSTPIQTFTVPAEQSTNCTWAINIPKGIQAITYKIVAQAENFTDGEEMTIPVVSNRMLVTESLPLAIRGKETKTFEFKKLLNNNSTTLQHHKLSLEFTSNPAWYAIQALPYLMEYPYECVEQTFSRYYANSIATHIANSNPKIKQVFDQWSTLQPDALLSNLEKNQALKSALLEETPWVLEAKDETQRKRAIALLFDLNRMSNELQTALDKVLKMQNEDGSFSWFSNFPPDRYMTQHIVSSIGHLNALGILTYTQDARIEPMLQKAIAYLDNEMEKDYQILKRGKYNLKDNHLNSLHIQYLYARSYFPNIAIAKTHQESFNYFVQQSKTYWVQQNTYLQGMIALQLHRRKDSKTALAIIHSLNERAIHHEELGMYWKYNQGYYWQEAPIESQALMIELYDEVAKDTAAVEALQTWLLKQKQCNDWKTTKATAEACYALLRRGSNKLVNSSFPSIQLGEIKIDSASTNTEAGTGYFQTSWDASQITPSMGKISIQKKDKGVAWGSVYWQYFEQLDHITSAKTPLQLTKKLFIEKPSPTGPVLHEVSDSSVIQLGDLVKVRIELRVDRVMEYVHLKDLRASGFEPTNVLSGYRYQDGLWYYENTKDIATHFFIGNLNKGTYVLEYSVRASQRGNFSNGITSIQCMYAPEFSSHSEGIRVRIK